MLRHTDVAHGSRQGGGHVAGHCRPVSVRHLPELVELEGEVFRQGLSEQGAPGDIQQPADVSAQAALLQRVNAAVVVLQIPVAGAESGW